MKNSSLWILLIFSGICYLLYRLKKKEDSKNTRYNKQKKTPVTPQESTDQEWGALPTKNSDNIDVTDEELDSILSYPTPKNRLDAELDVMMNPDDVNYMDENQFHPDYVEVLGAINEYNKGTIFNIANQPVLRVMDAEKRDVWPWANKFTFQLGRKTNVGLRIIDIFRVRKFITEDETKYQFDLVLQKESPIITKVKIILRVSCVFKFNYADESAFFKAHTDLFKPTPELDEIQIIGYTTGYYDIQSERNTEYYAFNNLENDEVIDSETIRKVVRRKKFSQDMEMRALNTLFDDDGRYYYSPEDLYPEFGTGMVEKCE